MAGEIVLVVGGAGYIGSHTVTDLLHAGYDVIMLDNLSRGHRDLLTGGTFIEGDLGDAVLLNAIFSRYRIAAIMHFAAFSLVGESVSSPLDYYRNNVAKTVELLMAMAHHGVRHFIFSSTAAVYGEPREMEPLREDSPCLPTNPYGATKLVVERMLTDNAAAGDFRYVSLRYFNAAGADPSGRTGERHFPETHLVSRSHRNCQTHYRTSHSGHGGGTPFRRPRFLVADSARIRRELGWRPRHEKLDAIIETAWAWHRKEAV